MQSFYVKYFYSIWQSLANNYILQLIFWQVDRLEDELMLEQDKHKAITEELEQTFAEMSGY